MRWRGLLLALVFLVGGLSSSAKSGRVISEMGCMVPQPYAAGGNRSYPNL
jgi:hypothetical protein